VPAPFRVLSWCLPAAFLLVLAGPSPAAAQADEIQVYDGGLAAPGTFNLTVHNNWTPKGQTEPAFPGAVVAHRSWNGVPEWAYGVTRWFEAGLYLPLYTRDRDLGWGLDGFKLRTLFAVPDADDRRFVYGANFEFSYNARRWDSTRFTSEIRPIVGWHFRTVDLIVNPIIDTAYDGFGSLQIVPAARLAYRINPTWQVAAEEYADVGTFADVRRAGEQGHQLFFVVDRTRGPVDIEAGIGVGLTDTSDRLTLKLILAGDLYRRHRK
jgi:hypothetical protein